MTLNQRNGIWHYDLTVNGKRYRGSTGKRNEDEAHDVASTILNQIAPEGIAPPDGKFLIDSWKLLSERLRPPKVGRFVYFIQMGNEFGPIKIGVTGDVELRLTKMRTFSPYPLTLLACIPGYTSHESTLHELFADHRLEGEWFRCFSGMIEFVKHLGICDYQGIAFSAIHSKLAQLPMQNVSASV